MPRAASSSATVSREPVERVVVADLARHEPEALGELVPHLLAERGAGVLPYRVVHDLGEVLSSQSRRAKPTRAKPGGSSPRLARS